MKNKIKEACFTFLAFFLFACGSAAVVFIGMMLMPVAFIAVFVLATREIIVWKRNKKLVIEKKKITKATSAQRQMKVNIRYMAIPDHTKRIA